MAARLRRIWSVASYCGGGALQFRRSGKSIVIRFVVIWGDTRKRHWTGWRLLQSEQVSISNCEANEDLPGARQWHAENSLDNFLQQLGQNRKCTHMYLCPKKRSRYVLLSYTIAMQRNIRKRTSPILSLRFQNKSRSTTTRRKGWQGCGRGCPFACHPHQYSHDSIVSGTGSWIRGCRDSTIGRLVLREKLPGNH